MSNLLEDGKEKPEMNVLKGPTILNSGGKGFTFENISIGSSSRPISIVLHNTGEGGLKIKKVYLIGEHADEFNIDNSRILRTIEENQYTNFAVIFKPKSLGTKNAKIKIKNSDINQENFIIKVTGTTIPISKPKNVSLFPENGKVTVSWDKVSGASSYNLYWGISPDLSKEKARKISDVKSPYVHSDLKNSETYYYIVTAVNRYGEGSESKLASARPGRTFYIDATNGDDKNDGLSPENAWRSIYKVREFSFGPGDYIYFKRGERWNFSLKVPSTGTEGNPITFGAYGNGDSPIISVIGSIPGGNMENNWAKFSKNIWYIPYDRYAKRLWLSGKEYVKAEFLENINERSRWYYDFKKSRLFVYSKSNPASYYSSIKESSSIDGSTVYIINKDHIRLRDLELRGGGRTVSVLGSSQGIIENCKIGWGSGIGIWISRYRGKSSDGGIIRGCKIDSGFRLPYFYEKAQSEDGIHMRNDVSYWEIYKCEIKNWGHTGVSLWQENRETQVSHNEIYSNFFTTEDVSYGRAFGTKGWEGGCSHNEFYRNHVRNVKGSIQIGGSKNSVHYNIIENVKSSPVYSESSVSAIILTPVTTPSGYSEEYVSNRNRILNNLVYECDGEGIKIEGWDEGYEIKHNKIANNIIVNCGKNSTYDRDNIGIHIQHQGYGKEGKEYRTATNNYIRNNLIYKSGASEVISYNGYKMTVKRFNEEEIYGDKISGNIQADPMFVADSNHDFHLRYLSPAIDRGIGVGLRTDFEGTPVPQGERVDIGAYEYH